MLADKANCAIQLAEPQAVSKALAEWPDTSSIPSQSQHGRLVNTLEHSPKFHPIVAIGDIVVAHLENFPNYGQSCGFPRLLMDREVPTANSTKGDQPRPILSDKLAPSLDSRK
jgi:hypothetical protein